MVYADLADARTVRNACEGVETVYHAAAKVGVWGALADYRAANVEGTQAIVNGCRDYLVPKLVYTSTPSVVFNGKDLSGADESLPYGRDIPCHYAATKAIAEQCVLAAHDRHPGRLKTVALRPHLIWGRGDPNLVPRVLERARAGRLRMVGDGQNKVDLSHIDNVLDAHLLAERHLDSPEDNPGGKAYFISNDEPVNLWQWINELLAQAGIPVVKRQVSLETARRIGGACELIWKLMQIKSEPPMTRFVASELAKDHWFDISAAKRDLRYQPKVGMAKGMQELMEELGAN